VKIYLARPLPDAVLAALVEAYEAAGSQGLCAEGRWEAAVGALRELGPRAGVGSVVDLDLEAVRRALEGRTLDVPRADDGRPKGRGSGAR